MACPRTIIPFLLLLTVVTVAASHYIREGVPISPFRAQKSENGTILFPSSGQLPPVLRGLSLLPCKDADEIFIAKSPFLAVSGTAIFVKSFNGPITLHINFYNPFVRIFLSAEMMGADGYTMSGAAIHLFSRPFAMRIHRSRQNVTAAVSALEEALAANPDGPRLVTVVDHSAAATSVGLSLAESSVVVFGTPVVGSQLWTRSPAAGIELPLEILIASSPLGNVYVAWNTASLLRQRFALSDPAIAPVLEGIDRGLANFAGAAANRTFEPADERFDFERIVTNNDIDVDSAMGDAVEAFERLTAAIEAAPPVGIAYQIPHEVSAMNAGLETNGLVNRVVVFGNPALGTGIMQRAFTAAIDLPVKMAVWTTREGAKNFTVGYTTPSWIGTRHMAEVPEMLSGALENFAAAALGS